MTSTADRVEQAAEGLSERLDDEALAVELSAVLDDDLVTLAKGRSPLDRSPKANWVEKSGGLPSGIEDLAVKLNRKGMSVSHAIATAVSKAKRWAVTSKDPKVKARWTAEVAKWEALKLKNKARKAAKTD